MSIQPNEARCFPEAVWCLVSGWFAARRMKICQECDAKFESEAWQCPSCGYVSARIKNFVALAPDLAENNAGFPPDDFQRLARFEAGNFWFRARNRLIIWALSRYFPEARRFLEIGCGTGFVLSGIEKALPQMSLSGSEIFSLGLRFASERVKRADLFQMDARRIPFDHEFDVIGAFDVLEHIKEDEIVLAQMYRAARSGGGIILTVPQHRFLWSQHDVHACHVRRYSAREIREKVESAGFKMLRFTSFVSVLLPCMMAARLVRSQADREYDAGGQLRIGPLLNRAFEKALDCERGVIRLGMNVPFGGSLLAVAGKA
jgi:SAM-dependent methyltransferase